MREDDPKIKLHDHQRRRAAEDDGHRYDEADAKYVMDNAVESGVQEEDGRLWYWAPVRGKPVLAVVSATATAAVTGPMKVLRVKTMHRRPKLGRRQKPPS